MALTIGDNFSYLGAKPLDGRIKYNTISAMVAMTADTLYDGIMAYCVEDGKEYQWKSTNDVDQTLGKWREFASGGASALDDLTDVDITSATDGQVLEYNNTSGKWVNANKPSIPSAYTSTPEMDGVGAAGSSTAFAKGDHVHPSDTSKADVLTVNGILDGTTLDSFGDVETALADKADKVSSATSGDFAGLDANGNLTDSGKAPSDLTGIGVIAPAFDATATYNIGDRCTYNGAFYKFTAAHTGAWAAADVTEITVNDAILSNTIGIGGGFAPVGALNFFDALTAPQDWLVCDGTVYNIADYPQLAAWYESQHGSKNCYGGNGTTTFAVPNWQGEYIRAAGTNAHTGQGDGGAVGEHQDATKIPYITTANNSGWFYYPSEILGTDDNKNADKRVGSNKLYVLQSTNQTSGNTLPQEITVRTTNVSGLLCVKAICAGEVYSTTEREDGTWIDGKVIYKKTIVDTMPTGIVDGTRSGKDINISALNIDTLVDCRGTTKRSGGHGVLNEFSQIYFSESKAKFLMCNPYDNNTKLYVASSMSEDSGVPVYVTLWYTKTI